MRGYDDGPIDPFFPRGRQVRGAAQPSAPAASRPAAGPRPMAVHPLARPASGRRFAVPLALLLLVGLAGGGLYLFQQLGGATVWVLNGFDVPVEVTLRDAEGRERVERIPARSDASLELSGQVEITAVSTNGQPIVEDRFEVPRGVDLVAYNLLGAAAVQLEEVVYSLEPVPFDVPEIIPLSGQSLIVRDDVEYIFERPPDEAVVPDSESQVTYWYFDYVGDGSWMVTVNSLLAPSRQGSPTAEQRARAWEIVSTMRRLDPSNVAARSFESMLRSTGPTGPGGLGLPAERPPLPGPGGLGVSPGRVIGPGSRPGGPGLPPGTSK